MIPPALWLVLSTVASRSMLILTLQTLLTSTSTLQVTRVLLLTTQVCSIALTFLFSRFVQLTLTPSSPRSASRLATAWSRTPSPRVLPRAAAHSPLILTSIIVVFRLQTSCDKYSLVRDGGDLRVPFFLLTNFHVVINTKITCCLEESENAHITYK